MATSAAMDQVITVKISYEGVTRRAKMPLRDMGPQILETQIRSFLHIPSDAETVIDRYSDSAAAYIMLDPSNVAVYKQLYRAAKAKSKLKLRVTVKPQEQPMVPQPATVEDEQPSTENTKVDTSVVDAQEAPPRDEIFLADMQAQLERMRAIRRAIAPELPVTPWNGPGATEQRVEEDHKQTNHFEDLLSNQLTDLAAPGLTSSEPPKKERRICAQYAVCCNSCDRTMPTVHWHCSTCEDGDFDLCQSCVDVGVTCHSKDHSLAKRTTERGHIVNCNAETKSQVKPVQEHKKAENFASAPQVESSLFATKRTCNSCVEELPERAFVHCQICDDYDLCQPCFAKNVHGHHPKHDFAPAVPGTCMPDHIKVKLSPGRNQTHQAICDGCDKHITGVRNKCLDCPDWDFCAGCIANAFKTHPKHRFVPIYEPLVDIFSCMAAQPTHPGICCDGPLCSNTKGFPSYIRGVRYKCAVCSDVDFCANCEASPGNKHNKTHPLIKFYTPVRHVSVTTTGEHQDGQKMPVMGDRFSGKPIALGRPRPAASISPARTVVDVKPQRLPTNDVVQVEHIEYSEKQPKVEMPADEVKSAKKATQTKVAEVTSSLQKSIDDGKLRATFVRENVTDGTILPANQVFEQTWVLRNDGVLDWPAGCSVKYVGGNYMGLPPSTHPASISELVSASESTVCYQPLRPAQEHSFTVLLRTPHHAGRMTSYWRLTTQDGHKIGDRLWCDVNVRLVQQEVRKEEVVADVKIEQQEETEVSGSQMIFPKLEKESPMASVYEAANDVSSKASSSKAEDIKSNVSDDLDEEEDWDVTDDGFMTDEEYDILDASDEEYLEEQARRLASQRK